MKERIKYIGITLLFLIIASVAIKYFIDKNRLEKNFDITTGLVYDYEVLARSGNAVYYEYRVDSIKYIGEIVIYENPKKFLNHRFKVKYEPSRPKNSEILLDEIIGEK
ncbi:hypothetical protein SAMN05444285_1627 [Draconibacterium orientale]|uniref:DUF3592 domain-containing protein n=1 Tax=Draconibacterium orientale TaxID=1168034 RepID=X5DH66_9BACT|nr:hypothetical protein [Draconibacterium orientale]AHW62333.1 hypothetical protein FH5T_19820 [Draconibacterium orientale]SEU15805.1 hypothetical protein SAMN05444285_1627 [Draconibacterium orientale]